MALLQSTINKLVKWGETCQLKINSASNPMSGTREKNNNSKLLLHFLIKFTIPESSQLPLFCVSLQIMITVSDLPSSGWPYAWSLCPSVGKAKPALAKNFPGPFFETLGVFGICYKKKNLLFLAYQWEHLTLSTLKVGILPKLRVGKWRTVILSELESCRHYVSEGWKVADTIFLRIGMLPTLF